MSEDARKPRNPRRPAVFRMREETGPAQAHPAGPDANAAAPPPRRPQALPAEAATVDERDYFDTPPDDEGMKAEADQLTPVPARLRKRRFSFGKLAAGAFGVLLAMAFGLWTDRLVRDLFSRSDWLGYLAVGAAAIFLIGLAIAVGREIFGLMRLAAVHHLREAVESARGERTASQANAAVAKLVALTKDKPETARGRAAIEAMEGEIVDGPELIAFTELELMAPLDRRARRLILDASKRVSVVTAVSPRAVVDLAYVLYEATRLVRAMATLYGGRPGTLGLVRLFRDVIAHLAVTSSIAVGDSLVQQVVGHGLASRLSSRLGEGVINGLMTARIGIAAMDLCRPMPFHAVRRPGVGDFIGDLTRIGEEDGTRR